LKPPSESIVELVGHRDFETKQALHLPNVSDGKVIR
jgi:hypothetical protein